MAINIQPTGDCLVVEVSGHLDGATMQQVDNSIKSRSGTGGRVILDCGTADSIDTDAVGMLVRMDAALKKGGGRFLLCRLPDQVMARVREEGLGDLLTIRADRSAALAEIGGPGPGSNRASHDPIYESDGGVWTKPGAGRGGKSAVLPSKKSGSGPKQPGPKPKPPPGPRPPRRPLSPQAKALILAAGGFGLFALLVTLAIALWPDRPPEPDKPPEIVNISIDGVRGSQKLTLKVDYLIRIEAEHADKVRIRLREGVKQEAPEEIDPIDDGSFEFKFRPSVYGSTVEVSAVALRTTLGTESKVMTKKFEVDVPQLVWTEEPIDSLTVGENIPADIRLARNGRRFEIVDATRLPAGVRYVTNPDVSNGSEPKDLFLAGQPQKAGSYEFTFSGISFDEKPMTRSFTLIVEEARRPRDSAAASGQGEGLSVRPVDDNLVPKDLDAKIEAFLAEHPDKGELRRAVRDRLGWISLLNSREREGASNAVDRLRGYRFTTIKFDTGETVPDETDILNLIRNPIARGFLELQTEQKNNGGGGRHLKILVGGYASTSGTQRTNDRLSWERAKNVARALEIEGFTVDVVAGFGPVPYLLGNDIKDNQAAEVWACVIDEEDLPEFRNLARKIDELYRFR